MPSIKPIGAYLPHLSRFAWYTERSLTYLGRWAMPLGLVFAIATGEMLAVPQALDGAPSHGTVWAAHLLTAGVMAFLLLYRGMALLRRFVRTLRTPPRRAWGRESWAWMRTLEVEWAARVGFWVLLTVLLLSGASQLFVDGFGWSGLPLLTAGGWQVLHAIASPFLYGCLGLLAVAWLGRRLPAFAAYLRRHY